MFRTENSAAPAAARGRFAGQQLAIGAHLVGLRIDLDVRQVVVVHEILLANRRGIPHRDQALAAAEVAARARRSRRRRETKVTRVAERARRRTRRTSADSAPAAAWGSTRWDRPWAPRR